MILEKEKKIERKSPKNFSKKHILMFEKDLNYVLPNIEIIKLKNFKLNSDGFIWKNFLFHSETNRNRQRPKISLLNKIKFFIRSFFEKKIIIDQGLWAIDSWSNNYFHWVGDVLYKFYLSKQLKTDIKLVIPSGLEKISFVRNSLKFLKIEHIIVEESSSVKVNNLYIISEFYFKKNKKKIVDQVSGNWHYNPILFLSKQFKNQHKPSKRIYITRKNASFRKIINEKEVIKFLKKLDFVIYDFDSISWIEQVEICQNTNLLFSINGAALTSILYMSEKSKVVEIRHPKGVTQNCYFSLCEILKLDYYYLIGDPVSDDVIKSDMYINLSSVKELFQKILYNV